MTTTTALDEAMERARTEKEDAQTARIRELEAALIEEQKLRADYGARLAQAARTIRATPLAPDTTVGMRQAAAVVDEGTAAGFIARLTMENTRLDLEVERLKASNAALVAACEAAKAWADVGRTSTEHTLAWIADVRPLLDAALATVKP